jgi:plastocyanin
MSEVSSIDRRTFLGFLGGALGGAAFYLVGCGGSDPTGGGGGDGSGGGPNADVVIEMENIAFVAPDGSDDVTIQLGQTVGWVNRDNVQHTATSTALPQGGDPFDSGLLSNDGTSVFEPNIRGTWVYHCEVHPSEMAGATITVT